MIYKNKRKSIIPKCCRNIIWKSLDRRTSYHYMEELLFGFAGEGQYIFNVSKQIKRYY